jgi:hypothetical protein
MAPEAMENSGLDKSKELAQKLTIYTDAKLGINLSDASQNEDPEAVAALEEAAMANDALQAQLDAMGDDLLQARTYIQQLTTEIIDEDEKTKADIYKTDANNATKIQVEAMQNEANLTEKQMDIVADAEARAEESQKELAQSMIESQPEVVVEVEQNPMDVEMPPIDGMTNDIGNI